jgi:hypothetical protein
MMFALIMLFQISVVAQAQMSTEILEIQQGVVPPHSPSANLTSLGSWNARSARAIIRKFDAQGKVFEFLSLHNNLGLRITGRSPSKTPPKFHIFLNGCSWTYGTGVAGDKTFAAHLEEQRPEYRVVNLAARGGSPAEALYTWRNFNWQEVYPEKKGFLIYTHIKDHYERLARSWRYLSWGSPMSPVFDEDLVESKPSEEFADYQWAKFVRSLGIDYWWLRGTAHFWSKNPPGFNNLIVKYMLAIKADYLKRYPEGRFVFAMMRQETMNFSVTQIQTLTAALEKAGIEYWIPDEPLKYKYEEYGIPRDGHPTELAHSEFAQFLMKRIP